MPAPKYNVGDIIDLRFTNGTMPDRIYIHLVYMKVGSTEWMYHVLSEKASKNIYMSESDITKFVSTKEAKCYNNPVIKDLYDNGYRFCGNYKRDTAFNKAHSMMNAGYIKHIILAEAVSHENNPLPDYLGLWVQYNTVIDTNKFVEKNKSGHYIIK